MDTQQLQQRLNDAIIAELTNKCLAKRWRLGWTSSPNWGSYTLEVSNNGHVLFMLMDNDPHMLAREAITHLKRTGCWD